MSFVYLILAFILNGAANVLLKVSALRGVDLGSYNPVVLITKNYLLVGGLVLFASNVVFYYLALRAMPVSIAYPVMVVMSFLIINSYAVWGIGESISVGQMVGYALLVLGLILIFYFKA